MTDTEIRTAIAEACGFKPGTEKEVPYRQMWTHPRSEQFGVYFLEDELPDYPHDLNAMHEAEKVLTKDARSLCDYVNNLRLKCCDDADEPPNTDGLTLWDMIHATARQRAEAFLRTLGKCKEEVK